MTAGRIVTFLVAAVFLLRSLLPAGFMLEQEGPGNDWSLVICSQLSSYAGDSAPNVLHEEQRAALEFLSQLNGTNDNPVSKPCDFATVLAAASLGDVPVIPVQFSTEISQYCLRPQSCFQDGTNLRKFPRAPPII
ncbi:hypothetical protein [Nisaea sp.]|uniref:hypothetical protein n=1 Tax=Nisaea sp. TaxID=2024842 RepID=UPI00326518FB